MHLLVEEFGAHCLPLGSLTRAPFAFTILHRALAFFIPLDIFFPGRQVLHVNSTLFDLCVHCCFTFLNNLGGPYNSS